MNQTATTIYKKLTNLEQQLQKLKVQAYWNLSKKQQATFLYPQDAITKALKTSRGQIWRQKYAKKIKGLS